MSRGPSNPLEAFETPVKVSNQQSEHLAGEAVPMLSLNLVQQSPSNNCLTNALQRSLSQANDITALGAPSWYFTDNFTESSPVGATASASQIPAQKLECSETLVEDASKMDSNNTRIRQVTEWRTPNKIKKKANVSNF